METQYRADFGEWLAAIAIGRILSRRLRWPMPGGRCEIEGDVSEEDAELIVRSVVARAAEPVFTLVGKHPGDWTAGPVSLARCRAVAVGVLDGGLILRSLRGENRGPVGKSRNMLGLVADAHVPPAFTADAKESRWYDAAILSLALDQLLGTPPMMRASVEGEAYSRLGATRTHPYFSPDGYSVRFATSERFLPVDVLDGLANATASRPGIHYWSARTYIAGKGYRRVEDPNAFSPEFVDAAAV